MAKKLSIIVPVYNVEKYIKKCLDSLKEQDSDDFEVIIVNDGTKDSSRKICETYLDDKRFKLYDKENGGLSSARNFGLTKATGEYISFIDSDDWVTSDYVSSLLTKLEEADYDLIAYDIININDGWEAGQTRKIYDNFEDMDKHELIQECYNPSFAWARIYKKELINNNKFPKSDYWYEDMYIMPSVILQAKNIGYIEKPLYYYRQRDNSITKSVLNPKTLTVLKAWEKNLKEMPKEYQDDYNLALYKSIVSFMYFKPEYAPDFLNFYKKNEKLFKNNKLVQKIIKSGEYEDLSKKHLIPKKIYYCWFGKGPKGALFSKCYESWKKYAPDFELIELNETNCDINECRYAKEAYETKKWAFVSDYFRVKELSKNGGIYVDTDVEFKKPIHSLTLNNAFFAFETDAVNCAIFGCTPKEKNVIDIYNSYKTDKFILDDGSLNTNYAIPKRVTKVLQKNTKILLNGKYQRLDGLTIYPADVLTIDVNNDQCIAEHLYEATWWDVTYGILSYKYTVLQYYFQKVAPSYDVVCKEPFKHKVKRIILKFIPKRVKKILKKVLRRS